MSAQWGEREIRAAERGGLIFAPEDVAQIHSRLKQGPLARAGKPLKP
jgi:hypothetical protein